MTKSKTRILLAVLPACMLAAPPAVGQDGAAPEIGVVNRTITDEPLTPDPSEAEPGDPVDIPTVDTQGVIANELLHVPITGIFPDGVRPQVSVTNPVADDVEAAWRGMGYFNSFNCIGCHAPNGAGGMGPSLSNATFKYGGDPANIYLTILQGRPLGMPAYGGFVPDNVIWDLVAYVRSISKDDTGQWGETTSLETFEVEQVPAQYMTTVTPWENTQPFSFGRPPFMKVETPEKSE